MTAYQARALMSLGRGLARGRGTPAQWYRIGVAYLQQLATRRAQAGTPKRALLPLRRDPLPLADHFGSGGLDIARAQADALNESRYYFPAKAPNADRASSVVPSGVAKGVEALTGVDISATLDSLQGVAASVLDSVTGALGLGSTGFSGGVDARGAAYIYSGDTIEEQQRRLLDTEGAMGTARKIINGEDVLIGGVGRGGPGFSEVTGSELPSRGRRFSGEEV